MHHSHHADLLEAFTNQSSSQLAPEDIYVPPHHQPINPEDEDDVVPDQHAAFGIQRATQTKKEVSWRDLGLDELVRQAPGESMGQGGGGGALGASGSIGFTGTRGAAPARREEPVRVALRRRPGAGGVRAGITSGGSESHIGGTAGNGLPR